MGGYIVGIESPAKLDSCTGSSGGNTVKGAKLLAGIYFEFCLVELFVAYINFEHSGFGLFEPAKTAVDVLRWQTTGNKMFTTSSAFDLINPIENGDGDAWKKFWRGSGPQRCPLLLW